MPVSTTGESVAGPPEQESDVAALARLVADALTTSVTKLREDDEARMFQFTTTFRESLATFNQDEGGRIARLEKAITDLKPAPANIDPATNFWTVYKKVADEHDTDMVAKYAGDLDTSLLFAGLFSAVATGFIVQTIPLGQPNPADLTNRLLLRILQHNTSFADEADQLAPVMNVPKSVIRAQTILFASLAVTLFVAFIAVLGKQWILYYTRGSTWGNIIDRGKERQVKFLGLQRWGLHLIMESLPVMLQFALLLFGVGLVVLLWDLNISAAGVSLAVTGTGCVFYGCIVAVATNRMECPFQTPLSLMLPNVLPWAKETATLARVWLSSRSTAILGKKTAPNHPIEDVYEKHYTMALTNPIFWRPGPLFTPLPSKDTAASAGFWLLENSTDFSAATAVAAAFPVFQWPSHHRSTTTTALVRLRDAYDQCFRAPKLDESTRLKALQSSAAYYVLYHTWLIWTTSKNPGIEVEKLPSGLPSDLLLNHQGEWNGNDLFEYLLSTGDRSEPVTSARFLSYVAPYWFCGDSDSAIIFRSHRLGRLSELISVLESSKTLTLETLTNCVFCVGAAMDFPLHPEDLIRVDKSNYFAPTFKAVVQHIHRIALAGSRKHRHATESLNFLLTIAKHTPQLTPPLDPPLVDAVWINPLLKCAAERDMADDKFALFLRLSALRKEEAATVTAEMLPDQHEARIPVLETAPHSPGKHLTAKNPTLDPTLVKKITKSIQTCVEGVDGWSDEAIYGGLIAIRDFRPHEPSLLDVGALQMLFDAMDKTRPFRVRKAAYDVMLVTEDQWPNSPELREKFKELHFLRQLYGVVVDIGSSDCQRSFLRMMGILSEDGYWQPYLRNSADIWLRFRHEDLVDALRILTNVGQLGPLSRAGSPSPPSDEPLVKLVEEEWAVVHRRPAPDLTVDRLKPLVEVTEQLMRLVFNDNDRKNFLAIVTPVIPFLQEKREDGYEGPGEDVRGIVGDLVKKLESSQLPAHGRRATYHR